jgi:hypothetical protein
MSYAANDSIKYCIKSSSLTAVLQNIWKRIKITNIFFFKGDSKKNMNLCGKMRIFQHIDEENILRGRVCQGEDGKPVSMKFPNMGGRVDSRGVGWTILSKRFLKKA